ncbi:MAG: reprolysin-like metallopeptidase [Pyrinomonadaceae bacterium]
MKTRNILKKYISVLTFLTIALASLQLTAFAGGKRSKNEAKKANKSMQQKTLWQQVERESVQKLGESQPRPGKYLVYRLNRKLLDNSLAEVPMEFTEAARNTETILEVPTPDGKFERFRIQETALLAPEVAAQFPTWKYFVGQGIDDPTATASFDTNDLGFHGYVSGVNGTYLIDPYSQTDKENYIVYYKGGVGGSRDGFSCQVKGLADESFRLLAPAAPAAFSNGSILRTLKSAWSLTKEYTAFFGNNKNTAFAALGTTVSRMNTIYRRDLAVSFVIVSDLRTVFDAANDGGFPAASDPNVASLSNRRNPVVLDTTYGQTSYDIGHVLSVTASPNGLALSPSLCDNNPFPAPTPTPTPPTPSPSPSPTPPATSKAQGFTGAPTPQGDGFDVDYVAHEIGHQFAMSHTFNNDADGSCSTREPDSAYEPASGITIMGYGGICAPRNLAENSIEYFNLRSFDQSLGYLQSTNPQQPLPQPCGTTTATNNTPPTVTVAQASYTIPALTPFTLNATATDANGDALTYLWEEFDLGAATRSGGAVDSDNDGTARPIFRAYNPTTGGARTFPSLYYILNPANNDPAGSNQPTLTYTGTLPFAPTTNAIAGYVCKAGETCVRGERLPTINRTMNFRVTVRDNNTAGGGVADAGTSVTVAAGAGPFQLTTQNSAANNPEYSSAFYAPEATWQAGTTQTVTWDVANTNAAPINAANVNILLSTDGGQTFPITLKANTPNDGTELITVPNNATTSTARIKVEAVGNIFFDINNANFAITAPTAASVSVSGRVLTSLGRGVSNARVNLTDQNGTVRTVRTNPFGYYRFDEVEAGQTYIFNVSHKRYVFSPRVVSISENLGEFNFTADN